MTRRRLLLAAIAALTVVVIAAAAYLLLRSPGRDEEFGTVDEYRLDPWVTLDLYGVDLRVEPWPFALALGLILFATVAGTWRTLRRRRARRARRAASR